jgi:DNA-binding MarR family transcriptional regulator
MVFQYIDAGPAGSDMMTIPSQFEAQGPGIWPVAVSLPENEQGCKTCNEDPATAPTLLELGTKVSRICRTLSTLLQAELNRLEITDIGPSQLMLLLTLRDGYSSVGDLGEQWGVKGSNLTYYINDLEKNAYVERSLSQQNRRTIQLKMQPKALQVCAAADLIISRLAYPIGRDAGTSQALATTHDTLLRVERLLCSLAEKRD